MQQIIKLTIFSLSCKYSPHSRFAPKRVTSPSTTKSAASCLSSATTTVREVALKVVSTAVPKASSFGM